MARGRTRKRDAFAVESDDDNKNATTSSTQLNIPTSQFRILPSGNFTTRTSVLNVPLAPLEQQHITTLPEDFSEIPTQDNELIGQLTTPPGQDIHDAPWVDPAYIAHVNATSLVSRKKRLSVCHLFKLVCKFLSTNMHRTNLLSNGSPIATPISQKNLDGRVVEIMLTADAIIVIQQWDTFVVLTVKEGRFYVAAVF